MAQRRLFDPGKMAAAGKTQTRTDPGKVFTVSQLNRLIKQVLGDNLPGTVQLVGEISNLTRPNSGHIYLTLKDDRSEIKAVIWRSAVQMLKFEPEDGMKVVASGHVDLYEPRGLYQLYIRKLEPQGTGALELAFRQLREKLEKQGLFDRQQKKPIPRFPRRIGIVTSETGAAVRDIVETIRRRFPCIQLLLAPVKVQGEGAAGEIARAIEQLNRQQRQLGGIDVIIVGRGGGSLEDLWAFNEETVARAIFASDIPVISAVGHEIDVTIADLVADLRAPTPTAAGELAVPLLAEVLERLANQQARLNRTMNAITELSLTRLSAIARHTWFRDPLALIHRADQQIDDYSARLHHGWQQRASRLRHHLHELELAVTAIAPDVFLHKQRYRLDNLRFRLFQAVQRKPQQADKQLQRTSQSLRLASPKFQVDRLSQQLGQLEKELNKNSTAYFRQTGEHLNHLAHRLESSSYRQTLARGFTVTRDKATGKIITDPGQVQPDQEVVTQTRAGEFRSKVLE